MKYVVMDMGNIVLWVSVCIRNRSVKDFALAGLYKVIRNMESLSK